MYEGFAPVLKINLCRMRCGTAGVLILALFASLLGDFAARSQASACKLAPCCVGKTATTCPMHHGDEGGTKMRSCSSDERSAVLPLAVLSTPFLVANDQSAAQATASRIRINLESLTTPPLTPPPRHV